MTWKGLLSCVCIVTVVAVACSSDDGKKASRAEDAGAGGESVDPNAGGSRMMTDERMAARLSIDLDSRDVDADLEFLFRANYF